MNTAAVGTYQVVVMFTPVEMRAAREPGRVTDAQAAEDVNMASTEPRGADRCQPNIGSGRRIGPRRTRIRHWLVDRSRTVASGR